VIHVNNIFNDIGGQFTAGVTYTGGQFCIVFGGAHLIANIFVNFLK
jgi:hypothetical protein